MDFDIRNNVLVEYIGTNARIVIPDGVTIIGVGAFYCDTSLTYVTIPSSVTNIKAQAFRGCVSLKEITLPDSITSIGHSAFYNCVSLTNITIPDSVTDIGKSVFNGCSNPTIKCNPGSYAESWAKDNGFKTAPIMSRMRLALKNAVVNPSVPEPDSVER